MPYYPAGGDSFNLNLLECKSKLAVLRLLRKRVLISTYWNVNTDAKDFAIKIKTVLISTYWNVNQKISERYRYFCQVLISTYWNVNIDEQGKWKYLIEVLISTYWNVNMDKIFEYEVIGSRFNLNLLECKCGEKRIL